MHVRGGRALTGVAITIAAAACTWLDPLDDISRPRATDAAGSDAASDPATDATAVTDAVTEAAAGPFCAAQDASFCEDFDDGTDVPGARWTNAMTRQGTLARAMRDDAPSPPNVLVAQVKVSDANQDIKAAVIKDFDVVPDTVHLEHDVRWLSQPSNGDVKLSVISLGGYELELMLSADMIGLKECYDPNTGCVTPPLVQLKPSTKPWMHVAIDLAKGHDGGPGAIKLFVDGDLVDQRAPADAGADLVAGTLRLAVGIYYTGSVDPIVYAFDNVTLSYR